MAESSVTHATLVILTLLASDDSCQQMAYAEGHSEVDRFLNAVGERIPFARLDASKVRQRWMYFRDVDVDAGEDDLVSDQIAEFIDRPAKDAKPVTILDEWLPLWERQKQHECHLDYVRPATQ